MNPWDLDPHHLAGAWRHLFRLLARRRRPACRSEPVGSCPAMG